MKQNTFSFPQIINRVSGKIDLSSDTQSINECLGILLRTSPGEMLGDPNWGCNLINRIFQYHGVIVEALIKEDIMDAIDKYEPRILVTMNDIAVIQDTNVVSIYLQYEIKETGQINEFNLDITPDDNPEKY